MNNRKRFFLNGILMSIVGLALRTVGLVFGAYISRTVGAEGVGLYTLINTVYAFALTFATSGISLTVTRHVAAHIGEGTEEEVGKTVRGAVIYALIFSGAATLVLAGASGVLASVVIRDARALLSLQILSLSLIPAALTAVISGYFVGTKRVAANALIQVTGQIFRIILTIFLLATFAKSGIEAAVSALSIGVSATEFAIFLLSFIAYTIDRLISTRTIPNSPGFFFSKILGMALPLAISSYIRSAFLSLEHALIPRRLVKHGESAGEALSAFGTMHGMALSMVLYPMSPLSSFSGLLVPEFASDDARGNSSKRHSRIAGEAISMTLIYAISVAALLFVFSEELGYVIYDSYAAGHNIALLAPIVPIMYLDHVVDSVLKGIGEHVYSMWVNIADSVLSVLLVFWLIPVFGISGYAFVIIGMELFNFTLSLIRLYSRVPFKVSFIRSVLLPLLSAVLSGYLVRRLFVPRGMGATLFSLVMELVFAAASLIVMNMLINGVMNFFFKGSKKSNLSREEQPDKCHDCHT